MARRLLIRGEGWEKALPATTLQPTTANAGAMSSALVSASSMGILRFAIEEVSRMPEITCDKYATKLPLAVKHFRPRTVSSERIEWTSTQRRPA